MGTKIANGIVLLVGIGIIFIGARFLLAPEVSAAGYGVPVSAAGEYEAFLSAKGIRDIASGLVVLTLFALGQRRALGWVMLAVTVVPFTDGLIVLSHGSVAAAFGWHFSTAAGMLVAVALLLSARTPKAATAQDSASPAFQTT
ncbi:DUF4267 domain-containing protein [Amycolatopsis magusensis]|uniref:DUF4267 domain-containing protein n=1 Tax=Amycolatopsis magusensis TaxID=882444 RepID=UPI0024A7EFEB|nr:DUF4267 domain-containing protein [Amycolatopsis magusensis]MDI5976523.1 DUF4267 domain-containing protein [Amycolatopsis magusensis]